MPDPSDYSSEDEWMKDCVPAVMDEGKDQEAAVGQCLGMWRNRDKAAPPLVTRAYSTLEVKSANIDRRELEGIASTPSVDRVGDIVEPLGAKFTLPMPLLWQHKHDQPIGHVLDAKATKNGITIKAKMEKEDEPGLLKDLLDFAWQSVKKGLVRGLSIGFSPKEYEPLDAKNPFGGLRYTAWDWHELSAVTIPAQAEATISVVKAMDQVVAHGKDLTDLSTIERAYQKRYGIKLPTRPAVRFSSTPVPKLKQVYLTEDGIARLQANGKTIKAVQPTMICENGQPLLFVLYSD